MENKELYRKLCSLRWKISREYSVPYEAVFNDTELDNLIKFRPSNMDELVMVKGFGQNRGQKYGHLILHVLNGGEPTIKLEPSPEHMPEKKNTRSRREYSIGFSALWPFLQSLILELDERSQDILHMLGDGYSQKEIADKYGLSLTMVNNIISNAIKTSLMIAGMRSRNYKEMEAKRDELTLQLTECRLRIKEITDEKIAAGEIEEDDYVEIKNDLLKNLEMSVRLSSTFTRGDIETVSELCRMTEKDFLRIPRAGKIQLEEARKLLAKRGLSFKKED